MKMPLDISALPSLATPTPAVAKTAASPSTTPAAAPSTAASQPHASPISLLDPSTGLVVLKFYDSEGVETASLPTKKQLDLYRLNEPSPNIFQPAIRTVSTPVEPAVSSQA